MLYEPRNPVVLTLSMGRVALGVLLAAHLGKVDPVAGAACGTGRIDLALNRQDGKVSLFPVGDDLSVFGEQPGTDLSRRSGDDSVGRIAVEGIGETAAGKGDFRSQGSQRNSGSCQSPAHPLCAIE